MALSDKRRSRRFPDPDPLELRVFLFIVGGAFFALPLLIVGREGTAALSWGFAVMGLFVILGACLLLVSILGSRSLVEKWSHDGGNEFALVVFLLAFPIAWLIRKWSRSDAA